MDKILLLNVNHSGPSQDLLIKTMEDEGASLAIVTEVHRVPCGDDRWVASAEDPPTVAITWKGAARPRITRKLEAGRGFAAVMWEGVVVVGCYFSPNKPIREYEAFLEELSRTTRRHRDKPVIILGDFNARSHHWDTLVDSRGKLVVEWAAELGLSLANSDNLPTCVHPRGSSAVDLVWANSRAIRMIESWKVDRNGDSLSDHFLIQVGIKLRGKKRGPNGANAIFTRWNHKKIDEDMMLATANVKIWPERNEQRTANEWAAWMREAYTEISDACAPRVRGGFSGKACYWWNAEIAELRRACNRARRIAYRARGRVPPSDQRALNDGVKEARRLLRNAITRAKASAWDELLADLNADPWGKAYRIANKKLRGSGPSVGESLDPAVLSNIVDELFPSHPPLDGQEVGFDWGEEHRITVEDLERAEKRIGTKKAPGPDGIMGGVLKKTADLFFQRWLACFNRCLEEGHFPDDWKAARLVLLRKGNKPEGLPSSYRPLCLLSEVGKLFERIIADRLIEYLEETEGLSGLQYGFRRGRSTVNAIDQAKELIREAVEVEGFAVVVGLDVANAFNSLPWAVVGRALEEKAVPAYLRAVIRDYFRNRTLMYTDSAGRVNIKRMSCGVPQGSVLGPLLWNIAYDAVLRIELPEDCTALCYADDTLVIVADSSVEEAMAKADLAVAMICGRIHDLGLKVAPAKTEAILFQRGRRRIPDGLSVAVRGVYVPLEPQIKYLGIMVDRLWSFRAHFEMVIPKAEGMAASLTRLMPNLRGPGQKKRKVYASIVQSVVLYGAPIWAEAVNNKITLTSLRRVQRGVNLRVISAYRTVSHEAAAILAGQIPLELLAKEYARTYTALRILAEQGRQLTRDTKREIRSRERERTVEEWRDTLGAMRDDQPGARVRNGLVPRLDRWLLFGGELVTTFRATQILTGHGCLNYYLFSIRRADTVICAHCNREADTAEHTLMHCASWERQREPLLEAFNGDCRLENIWELSLRDTAKWRIFTQFCETVIREKEEAERARQRHAGIAPSRRRPPRARLRRGQRR
jgi:hypothetical protein